MIFFFKLSLMDTHVRLVVRCEGEWSPASAVAPFPLEVKVLIIAPIFGSEGSDQVNLLKDPEDVAQSYCTYTHASRHIPKKRL